MHRMAYGYRVFVCSNMAFAGEFTPVFAKHSRSFSLIDSLAIGVDRMQRSFGPMQKKGRKGSMREKGIDGRHREVESFRLGDQSGTTPFVNTSAVPSTDLVKLPPSRLLVRDVSRYTGSSFKRSESENSRSPPILKDLSIVCGSRT